MADRSSSRQGVSDTGHGFGTFQGVFLPSILTMIGAIMFLRVNLVTGEAGIGGTLIILALAASIVLATSLSISAISTNTPVKGGGVYFLISRTLGPGFGGSIGVTLFLAQALSIPFNILGFAEALANDFPALSHLYLPVALLTAGVLLAVTVTGADWAMKFQMFIFAALALGILSFMGGAAMNFDFQTFTANMGPQSGSDKFILFALFFPAMTGIMAGVNMSGDLKNPARSIPEGIIWTVFAGAALYAVQILLCGGAFSRESLVSSPYKVMVDNAPFHFGVLVTVGVAAATLSTALGLLICAPRVLQALARDRIIDGLEFLGKGSGPHNEPRAGLALTAVFVLGVIYWAGSEGLGGSGIGKGMNMVAEIATMFFLFTYTMVNLAAFVESYGANPSFRPRFKFFHWVFSLYGFLACAAVSVLIDAVAAFVSAIVVWLIFSYIKHRKYEADFGDARRGFIYSRIRENLLKLSRTPAHPKNWRPTIVILSGRPEEQMFIPYFASLIESERGIISLAKFVETDDSHNALARRRQELDALSKLMWDSGFYNIFPEVVFCESYDKALKVFLQSHLVGPLKPNIVMLGYPRSNERAAQDAVHIRTALDLKMSCVMMVNFNDASMSPSRVVRGRIDLWWRGVQNLSLMLILAHLLVTDPLWQGVYLRILRVARKEEDVSELSAELDELVESARIEAEAKTIFSDEPFGAVMRRESANAAAVFLGFLPPQDAAAGVAMFESTRKTLAGMPPTFLVCSSGEADLSA